MWIASMEVELVRLQPMEAKLAMLKVTHTSRDA